MRLIILEHRRIAVYVPRLIMPKIPARILKAYDLGSIKKIELISSGHIHRTFKLSTSNGTFILQRLHPLLASQKIARDTLAVTKHLEKAGFPAPRCILTKRGRVLASDGKHRWRLQTCIAGRVFQKMQNTVMAKEAGKIFGRFHRVMDAIPHRFQTPLVWFNTPKRYADFMKTVRRFRKSPLMDDVRQEVALIERELPKLFMPSDISNRVIHADPKISNIIFYRRLRAKAIIDLDLCQRRPLPLEMGDALRSWCGQEEDDPRNAFNLSFFRAAWSGYEKETAGWLTEHERALIPQGIATVTLELASRFLADYFNDSYFGWNPKRYPSRRASVLAHARGQIALYKDLIKKQAKIKKILGLS